MPDRTIRGEFTVASAPGNERGVSERVAAVVSELGLPAKRVDAVRTAVAEATMNAMEHGNEYRPDLSVEIEVATTARELTVQVTDHGGHMELEAREAPDIQAKLAGEQSPRGWGLLLIEHMVDELRVDGDKRHRTVELVFHLQGDVETTAK